MSILDREISRKSFLIGSTAVVGGVILFNNYQKNKSQKKLLEGKVERKELKKVNTFCFMCGNTCGLIALVDEDGKVQRIEPNRKHIGNNGGVCARAHASIQQLYDPDRLKAPMKKVAKDRWEEISWEEAIDTVYEKLTEIKEKYGPETVSFINRRSSYGFAFSAFARNYGSPNVEGSASICDGAKIVAHEASAGTNGIMGDFENAKYILLAGASQMEAPRYRLRHVKETALAKERGAILTVVDPRYSYTASKADNYLGIKPGTDAMLFLSMARVIIEEGLYDKEFVEKYSVGFEEFKEEVFKDKYSLENAEKVTGIKAEVIRKTAIEFATNLPAIADSSSGIHKWTNGTMNHWALTCLNALVGSFDVKGGYCFTSGGRLAWPEMTGNNVKAKRHYTEGGWSFHNSVPLQNRSLLNAAILTPKEYPAGPKANAKTVPIYNGNGIKAMFVYNTDPVAAHSNTIATKEALESLEFAVGIDIYLSQTMTYFPVGSIIMPECTFLERWAAVTPRSHVPYVALGEKVVEPLWNSKSAYWIFVKLGKRFGFEDFLKLDENDEEGLIKRAITEAEQPDGTKIDWEQIRKDGVWVSQAERKYRRYDRFPNGKFAFAFVGELTDLQQAVVDAGGSRVPQYVDPVKPNEKYPFRFLAGGKTLWHTQGATRNLPYLMQNFCENAALSDINYINIHTSDAEKYGIKHGDKVKVRSAVGEVIGQAFVSERVQPGFINVTHGFGNESKFLTVAYQKGVNPNYLINDLRWDRISGQFTVNEEICELIKV
ncbi:molybdopterin-containing oxidoreductase family protein [Anaerobranca gottschalkii]|uniref:Thiosulfate reductase / polysulfide reductase chain A n=1 Tax=Anaerobranca gottschalkii DSM 13577 TaxID=1120990 RepID=A0A1H9YPY4_9FIRM|nr:molybdopterin-dependent oxidoreductase [Anaerobranca gottschalkii]SES71197.1 thiosulfate reductase / polysulfide reductase chain A [Anaerobranca gottschalkii DSM 13577]